MDGSSIEREIEGIQARLRALHDELDVAREQLEEMIEREQGRGRVREAESGHTVDEKGDRC